MHWTQSIHGSADHEQGPCPVHDLGLGSEEKPFEAAMLFNDQEDWYRDLQLFTDIALSGRAALGTLIRMRPRPGHGPSGWLSLMKPSLCNPVDSFMCLVPVAWDLEVGCFTLPSAKPQCSEGPFPPIR